MPALYRNLTEEESAAVVAAILNHREAIDAELAEYGITVGRVTAPEMVRVVPSVSITVKSEGLERAFKLDPEVTTFQDLGINQ